MLNLYMTKCGKYRDPDYISKYRENNREKFVNYSRIWLEKKMVDDPTYRETMNERARNYYQENKDWILERAKLKRAGSKLPDRPDRRKNKKKKVFLVDNQINPAPENQLIVKQGNFNIEWI